MKESRTHWHSHHTVALSSVLTRVPRTPVDPVLTRTSALSAGDGGLAPLQLRAGQSTILETGSLTAALQDAWRFRVGAGTGWPCIGKRA